MKYARWIHACGIFCVFLAGSLAGIWATHDTSHGWLLLSGCGFDVVLASLMFWLAEQVAG